jgi:general secretion pathway protein G
MTCESTFLTGHPFATVLLGRVKRQVQIAVDSPHHGRRRRSFSLVEMVVVILLVGIIAAVAAPRMFYAAEDARANSAKRNLAVIRDALGMYRMRTGRFPAADAITTELGDYLRGPFPPAQVGGNAGSAEVAASQADPITSASSGPEGWIYNESTGEFRINDVDYLAW